MKRTTKLYRQGDVMFLSRAKAPKGERKPRRDGVVMHGEVTGHAHRLGNVQAAEVYDLGDSAFLSVTQDGGVSIVHEDHATIVLPKGEYAIRIQREYTPEGLRNVVD